MNLGEQRKVGRADLWMPLALLTLAAVGWWWSVVSAGDMDTGGMSMQPMPTMSLAAFLVAWVAMTTAGNIIAVPVVRLYARAARSCTFEQLERPVTFSLGDIVPGLG
ncbi:MAG: hypothetical protein U1D00_06265 [Mycobacterium sp.]|nr:hypothetical protein [Mycobacterium sp.]